MPFPFLDNSKAVIPIEYVDSIINQAAAASAALTLATRVNMGTNQTIVPVSSVLPTAAFVGQGAAIGASVPQWAGKNLIAAKLAAIVPIAREVWDDAQFSIENDLLPKIASAIGAALDSAIFTGTGYPSTWTAGQDIITKATAAGSTVTVSGDILQDINDLMELVETDNYDVNGFCMLNSLKASLRGLRDTNGQPIYNPMTAGFPASLYGENVFFSKNGSLSADCQMVVGDFSKMLIGVRKDMTMELLTEASITTGADTISLGQNDMVALKVVARFGFEVANSATGVSGAYPFAMLKHA